MRNIHFLTSFLMGTMVLFSSCSSTKYVPKDSCLLNSVKVKSESNYSDINTLALRNYVRQMPNSRWFSLYKLPLAVYSLSGRDSTKWINRTLKSMGEAPVVYDSLSSVKTCADLTQQLKNEGFLDAQVKIRTTKKRRKVNVEYILEPGGHHYRSYIS